jgi:hypothetical protein
VAAAVKVAVTARACDMLTEQVLDVPVQAPLQPAKVLPLIGAAVKVTLVPEFRLAEQVVPQDKPPALPVTVPAPVPSLVMDRVYETGMVLKVAVTDWACDIATEQVLPVPLQAPPQPAKVLPVVAAAVRVTLVPAVRLAEQVLPQEMPPVLPVTVPAPVPFFVTDRA